MTAELYSQWLLDIAAPGLVDIEIFEGSGASETYG